MTVPNRRIIVLRTSRDTLVLVACTIGMTLVLAYAVHQRPAPAPALAAPEQQVWAGQLADVAPPPAQAAPSEPMSSATLVVPKAALALPPLPAATANASVSRAPKVPACDAQICPAKTAAPVPPPRQKPGTTDSDTHKQLPSVAAATQPATGGKARDKRFALSDLNPLPHLPDAVRRPFNYAGGKISGWIDWF